MTALTPSGRPLTGRFVLACFLGFFAVIFAANIVMVRVALGTFGGVETESAYKAGLAFKADAAQAAAQAARGWTVEAHIERGRFAVAARDGQGRPVEGMTLRAVLHHPSDRRHDVDIDARPDGVGRWTGDPAAPAGQWDLVIELFHDGDRAFRSVNRVVLR